MTLTRDFLVAATLLDGILAGINIDGMIVRMPAWRQVGAQAWAAYSRKADLRTGLILYPVVALGGATFTVGAAIIFHFDQTAPASAAIPIYGAAILVIGGLLATIKAAPRMLSLKRINDEDAERKAFEGFYCWSAVRAVPQVLAFVAALWSLVAIL